MKRSYALVGFAAALLAGCGGSASVLPTKPATVIAVNAVAGSDLVSLTIGSTPVFDRAPYGRQSRPIAEAIGPVDSSFRLTNHTTGEVLSGSASLTPGSTYGLYANGAEDGQNLFLYRADLAIYANGMSQIMFVNVSRRNSSVDVYVSPTQSNAPSGAAPSKVRGGGPIPAPTIPSLSALNSGVDLPSPIAPGRYDLQFAKSGTQELLVEMRGVEVIAGQNLMVAIGDPPSGRSGSPVALPTLTFAAIPGAPTPTAMTRPAIIGRLPLLSGIE